ncbi:hypothetical protein M0R45_026337 [Rubus argutus]|uniref:Uncharacterized protein n=1 Tax=Rubus argutus TaxID=59490 RepID=A0AAW1WZT0_RUBAR
MAVNVSVLESTMVKPAVETPQQSLWISNLDMVQTSHNPSICIYKPNNGDKDNSFFDMHVLKHALSKALVPFYPLAGRLKRNDENGRIEINCNAEGALFVAASSNSCISDFWRFCSHSRITYLKCGGVAVGVLLDHRVADGLSALRFLNTWSEMARGIDLAIPPMIDRTLLRARDPPRTLLDHNHHIAYQPPKDHDQHERTGAATVSVFRFTREQLDILKRKTMMLHQTAATALVGDLISKPKWYAANCIHNALVRMDNDYLRSALDYLELEQHHQDLSSFAQGTDIRCPNFKITSWFMLPQYDSDLGGGHPFSWGLVQFHSQHMKSFSKLVYDI